MNRKMLAKRVISSLHRTATKMTNILFQTQHLLAEAHQEVALLVALHQAPNHMVLRVAQGALPLPTVPRVVPGVHTALHHLQRTFQLDEDKLYQKSIPKLLDDMDVDNNKKRVIPKFNKHRVLVTMKNTKN